MESVASNKARLSQGGDLRVVADEGEIRALGATAGKRLVAAFGGRGHENDSGANARGGLRVVADEGEIRALGAAAGKRLVAAFGG